SRRNRKRPSVRHAAVLAMLLCVAAAAAGSASAKGRYVAKICGSHCVTVSGPSVAVFAPYWSGAYALLDAPRPAPYYAITLSDESASTFGVFRLFYVPSRHMVRIWQSRTSYGPQTVPAYWRSLPRGIETSFRRLVSRVAPRAAPRRWPASLVA
ncbi:MAG TPA: hypothetical protein VJP39_07805, partial [Gaiellaceae bacterium]|nr:hypothetical protein [Gaiellaceae bacterium]